MACKSSVLTELAPAKINLALHVTGLREDGYHLLESLVVFTRFGDILSLEPAEATTLSATGHFAEGVPLDGSNLILRARDLLAEAFPHQAKGHVRFTLEKNLPVASGIGGGSSDAAAAARLLACHWQLPLSGRDLASLLQPLGADVPMCALARPLIARGVGEKLEPVRLPALPIVLVNPSIPLSTPPVFRALAHKTNPALPPLRSLSSVSDVIDWLQSTRNDLEPPAASIVPEIAGVIAMLSAEGASLARMSGSGATCFGLFPTEAGARRAAESLAARHPDWFIAATTTFASEDPV